MFRQILSFFTSKATMEAGMAADYFSGESLVGDGNEIAHIDLIVGPKMTPLIARQIPIREGEKVTGFVDLALERAFHYRPGKPSEQTEIPASLAEREAAATAHAASTFAGQCGILLVYIAIHRPMVVRAKSGEKSNCSGGHAPKLAKVRTSPNTIPSRRSCTGMQYLRRS